MLVNQSVTYVGELDHSALHGEGRALDPQGAHVKYLRVARSPDQPRRGAGAAGPDK